MLRVLSAFFILLGSSSLLFGSENSILKVGEGEYEFTHIGKKIKVEKYLDINTGEISSKLNGEKLSPLYLNQLDDLNIKEKRRHYGNSNKDHYDTIKKMKKDDSINVLIQVKYDGNPPPAPDEIFDPSKIYEPEKKYYKSNEKVLKEKYKSLKKENNDWNDEYFFQAKISKEDYFSIIHDENIAAVELYQGDNDEIVVDITTDYWWRHVNDDPVYTGYSNVRGQGVNVGWSESRYYEGWGSCIGFSSSNYSPVTMYGGGGIPNSTDKHAMLMSYIEQRISSSANKFFYAGSKLSNASVNTFRNWVHSKSIDVIGQSTANVKSPTSSASVALDNMAYEYTDNRPVIIVPSGNLELGWIHPEHPVYWRQYNTLSVGGGRNDFEGDWTMWDRSLYVNQLNNQPKEPERPHVIAAAQSPDIPYDSWFENCYNQYESPAYWGWGIQGTSIAAPIVAGIAGNLIGHNSIFQNWPERVRAAIIATAEDVDGIPWTSSQDLKDGTGAVSRNNLLDFSTQAEMRYPNVYNPAQYGIYGGSWYSSQTYRKKFYVEVPSSIPTNQILRVVLIWNSRPDVSTNWNQLSDLDLTAYNDDTGYYKGGSYSVYNNAEVIEFDPQNLTPGEIIRVELNPYLLRFPNSSLNFFNFAVAWTWVDTNADN